MGCAQIMTRARSVELSEGKTLGATSKMSVIFVAPDSSLFFMALDLVLVVTY